VLAANNIVYVSSAGNDAQKHYQGDYYNDGFNFHDFSRGTEESNNFLYLDIPDNGEVTIILQWKDAFGDSGNDYDLILFNMDGFGALGSSFSLQDGNDNPLERIDYTNTTGNNITAEIDVNNSSGQATNKTLELFIYQRNGTGIYLDNISSADSIYGHPAVPGVIAVGAIAADDPGNDTIEPFSSLGPVTIIGQGQRVKPDITGIDKVAVTGAGGFGDWDGSNYIFGGTSAAAPAVAAIVAQLWGQYPLATASQIKTHLLNSAVDLGSSGTDNIFGHGRADALLAVQAGPTITSFNFTTPAATGVINSTSINTVTLDVPYGTDVTKLVPAIAITGASISPASGVSQNFTSLVTYTVTATDGLTQAYTVTVAVAAPTTHTISGTIKYYDGTKVIPNALVILEDDIGTQIATTTTDVSGVYQFENIASGSDYVVRASKNDTAIGLTGADQGKIGRHIVGLEIFDSIYKIISGDVNNSGGLTGADQGKIGRFIVGLDSNLSSGTWKFYSSVAALDTTNYLATGLTRIYTNLVADMSSQDFVGVKMGDVNNSWTND